MAKYIIILIFSFILAGCLGGPTAPTAPTALLLYNGPSGSTFVDLAKARTACYSQLKSSASSGFVGQYSGSFSRGPSVDCGAFNGCLASKGFYKSSYGNLDASSIKVSCTNP